MRKFIFFAVKGVSYVFTVITMYFNSTLNSTLIMVLIVPLIVQS